MDSHSKVETIRLNNCELTEKQCSAVAAVLSCKTLVREMNLNNSRLLDSGLKHICDKLKNPQCQLHILNLSECSITEGGYVALSEAVRSNPSHLISLDLTGNDPGPSGVKLIHDLLEDTNCALNTVRFLRNPCAVKVFEYLIGSLGKNPLLEREVNLGNRKLDESRVRQISDLLQDKHCQLNTLTLNSCRITAEGCAALTAALNENPSHVKELNLSGNTLGDSGIKNISHLMKNSLCTLKKLKLSECSITEEGYRCLSEAVRSNPSHLISLDLSGNDPGPSGVKLIYDLIQDTNCALNTVRFLKSRDAEAACVSLTEVLGENPLLLKELNLSDNKLRDLDGEKLSALLMDSHSKVEKIRLNNCELTEKQCSAVAAVLSCKTLVREMNLNNSRLLDSGLKHICDKLKNPQCQLHILNLSECSITEGGYVALSEAVRSNPSHLISLDLTGNDPGPSGVKLIHQLIQDTNCALKRVRLLKSSSAMEALKYLTGVLGKNPLLQSELNLSNRVLYESRVRQISDLLQDKHCQLNTLTLNSCRITAEGCAALTAALNENPSHVKELNLSGNTLGDSGIKNISHLMKNSLCTLKKLNLSECSITEEGYRCLSEAVRSNPSHLISLDLSGNDPGPSGVKLIHQLIQDTNCALNTVRFLKSRDAEAACVSLTEVLGENPLLLKELNLSDNKLRDLDGEKLSALLMDSHSKVEKIRLNNCELTEKQCSAVAAVLSCKTLVREMNLNNSRLLDSGLKHICDKLKNPQCQLHILNLSECSITEGGYRCLSEAVRSNPSHLISLDLTGNDPGPSGVQLIHDLLEDTNCALNTVRFLKSRDAEAACVSLTEVLGENPLLLKELNLSDNKLRDLDGEKLSALLMDSHSKVEIIRLNNCELTEKQCSAVAAVLSCKTLVREMNLNNSRLLDSGLKHICDKLKNPQCQLHILNLSECSITEEGYRCLSEAVRSNPSHLISLDLSGNDPGPSGVKLIYDLLEDTNCALNTVRLLKSSSAAKAFEYLKTLGINALLQSELNLSKRKLEESRVRQISDLLQDKHCQLNTLRLSGCSLTQKCIGHLVSALSSNCSHLRELDLSNHELGDTGVPQFMDLLKNSDCKLEKLWLRACGLTDQGSALFSALNSNPSHLRHLNLSENKLGKIGANLLGFLLKNPQCQLETLELRSCGFSKECCADLSSALNSNPSHLRHLNLSKNNLGTSGVNKLSDLLKNPQCKLKTLVLCKCSIDTVRMAILIPALCSNPSHLRHLNLSQNEIKDAGVNHLCDLLKHCKLEKLELCGCSLTEKHCARLISALCSNPSHLTHLNLSGNNLGTSGVNKLSDLLKNPQCKLKTLVLCKCSIDTVRMAILIPALCSNPSHLKELNLSQNEIKDAGVDHLCDLLKHCKLEKLELNGCSITDVSCLAETPAVRCLEVLDLSNNKLGNSEKKLRDTLKDSKSELRLESQGWFSWRPFSWKSGKPTTQGDEPPSSDEQPSEEEDEGTSSQKKTVTEREAADLSQDPTDDATDEDDDDDAEYQSEDQTKDQADACAGTSGEQYD
ncbi:protein NLRC5-like isoform X2 [Triplophysa rosa]|uniref:protein NLRC5-like isoform X2 n=1 Tax=Triplophysa rosa TaxID=992332 RepID=UPI002545E344|nr:protein NLRC5-like isoform X2 [Triplophysa rosa]